MLPQYFARQGCFTACCGKVWHDGAIKPPDQPNECNVFGPAPSESRHLEVDPIFLLPG